MAKTILSILRRPCQPFVEVLDEAKVNFEFTVIENGGHIISTGCPPSSIAQAFKRENPRDPLPDVLQWVADRTDIYNRNHWLVIDERTGFGKPVSLPRPATATRL